MGFTVDSAEASIILPARKLRAIRKEIRCCLARLQVQLRQLSRIIGLMVASIKAIFPAPLHYRSLQRLKIAHLRRVASYAN